MILAVIPARGGSKGIPRKNVRLMNGKPLIYYAIHNAKNCPSIDDVVVSSDDEEILKMTSETSAIGEQYFRLADEKAGNNLLYRTVTNMKPELSAPVKDGHKLTSPENLFRFQSEVIRKLAESENCIIIGRCGNYVLQDQLDDVIRIFVYADTVTRVRRIMDVDKVDEEEALRRMRKIDKERTEYHKYFTGRNWMDMENYDLPINASRIDYDEMIILIKDYLKLRGMID